MTPVREKFDAVEAGQEFTGEIGTETLSDQPDAPESGSEREGRRVGILLIVIGCVLMALAAGESYAVTIFAALVP